MGLRVNLKTDYGVDCTYAIISKIEMDKISKNAYIVLYYYIDKISRDNNNKYLERKFVNIYPDKYDTVFGLNKINNENMNDYKSVYEFLKENINEFKEATDC